MLLWFSLRAIQRTQYMTDSFINFTTKTNDISLFIVFCSFKVCVACATQSFKFYLFDGHKYYKSFKYLLIYYILDHSKSMFHPLFCQIDSRELCAICWKLSKRYILLLHQVALGLGFHWMIWFWGICQFFAKSQCYNNNNYWLHCKLWIFQFFDFSKLKSDYDFRIRNTFALIQIHKSSLQTSIIIHK